MKDLKNKYKIILENTKKSLNVNEGKRQKAVDAGSEIAEFIYNETILRLKLKIEIYSEIINDFESIGE